MLDLGTRTAGSFQSMSSGVADSIGQFKRRRVAILAFCCDGNDVGEARSSFHWVQGLSRIHDVTLLSCKKHFSSSVVPQLPGTKVVEISDFKFPRSLDRLVSMLKPGYARFFFVARRWLERAKERGEHFDLVHQLSPLAMRYPCPALGLNDRIIIGPIGGSVEAPRSFKGELGASAWYSKLRFFDKYRFRYDALLRRTYSSAKVVIGVAPYVQELLGSIQLQHFCTISETAVESLPAEREEMSGAPGQELRLLFVGRIVRSKGLHDVIRAISLLRDLRHIKLDVVGDGNELPVCKAEATSLGIADRIKFHGKLPRTQVAEYYRRAHIFVFPSFREASGNVVFEAMSHGLALIVAACGGPGHVVAEGCGIRIVPSDPATYVAQIAEAIRKLENDRTLLRSIGLNARRQIAEQHTWRSRIEQMCHVYESVCEGTT